MGQYKQEMIDKGRELCFQCGDFHDPEDLRLYSQDPRDLSEDYICEPCFVELEKLKPNEVWVEAGPCWDDLSEVAQ